MTFSVNFVVSPDDLEPLELFAAPAPTVVTGQPYSVVPTASGGVPPYIFTRTAGSALPAGWTFSMLTGTLETPAAGAAGAIVGTVIRARDAVGAVAEFGPFDIEILAAPVDPPVDPEPTGAVFYVAPETGSDALDGLTPATAWRNCPGTKNGATGVSAATTLLPGAAVRFIAGQALRKTLFAPSSGTVAAPIIFETWSAAGPPHRAVLDGADPVALVRPAESQADAGGAANWEDLHVVLFDPVGSSPVIYRLFDDFGIMPIGRFPALADPIFEDDIGGSSNANAGKYVDVSSGPLKVSGELASATLAGICADQMGYARVNMRIRSEVMVRYLPTEVVGDTILIPEMIGANTYDLTRTYVTNSRHHCTTPGSFAVIAPGKAVVKLRGSANIRIGRNRHIVNFDGQSHIRVRGFEITAGMMIGGTLNEVLVNRPSPLALGNGSSNWEFNENYIHDMYGERRSGQSPRVFGADNFIGLRCSRNRIRNLVQSGLTRAPDNHFFENVISRCGGTVFSGRGGSATTRNQNILSFILGIHANGLSLYGDGEDVFCNDNFVFGSERPLTMQGESGGDPAKIHNRTVLRNVLIGSGNSVALNHNSSSPTYPLNTVRIEGNVAIAMSSNGLQVYQQIRNLTLQDNIGNSLRIGASVEDNTETWTMGSFGVIPRSWATDNGFLTEDHCRMEGPGGVFYELDLRDVAPVA